MADTALRALATLAAVSLIKRRELGIPPGRCPACRDWPGTVVYVDDEVPPASAAGCACGWGPVPIHVVHVTDWRPRPVADDW